MGVGVVGVWAPFFTPAAAVDEVLKAEEPAIVPLLIGVKVSELF